MVSGADLEEELVLELLQGALLVQFTAPGRERGHAGSGSILDVIIKHRLPSLVTERYAHRCRLDTK
jgi:hypothetical protein